MSAASSLYPGVSIDTLEDYVRINRLFAHYGDGTDLLQKAIADVRRGREAGLTSHAKGV